MMSFRMGTWKMGGGRTAVVLPAESSQTGISRLNELALLAPVIESRPAKTLEIPKSARPREKLECFYSGWRTQRLKLWVSSLPLTLILALGYSLYFTGAPEWIAETVMLGGIVVFGLARLVIEYQGHKAFVCPCCQAPINDWDISETRRILFDCARCESSWDIEYKEHPYHAGARKRLPRTYPSILCSLRGVH
jgi:hypothetical protein